MTAILVIFIFVYYLLEAIRDHFVTIDVRNHSDILSPERRAWHFISASQSLITLSFLYATVLFDLHFNITGIKLVLLFLLARRVAMENFKNVLDGGWWNILYVDKNYINSIIHWFADKSGIPVQLFGILLTLALIVAIIFL